jgi:HAD superfamily hydrolase (TIGR01484 family)
MAPTHYDSELEKLAETYQLALKTDVERVKIAITGASGSSLIGVGSGGSFTAASFLCNLHESYTGRVSRPSTPLEIICNPTLASASPVFLISAEGRNPDVIEALQRARMHSPRPVHILTNRPDSALVRCAERLTNIDTHVFELAEKDGYLATNSLLLNAMLIARAYGELDDARTDHLPASINELRLADLAINDWLLEAGTFAYEAVKRGGMIVTYSPLLRPVAADLESKLAESALLHCQLADFRSFAHGRHIWLADRPRDCVVLGLVEPSLQSLWDRMRRLFPAEVPTYTMPFGGAKPRDLLAGLVAQMHFISVVAASAGKDPGRPKVAPFGRDLHYIDLPALVPDPSDTADRGEQSKYEVLGARWPSIARRGLLRRALERFAAGIQERTFRAIVFDYDGTLCNSHRNDLPPTDPILQQLCQLADGGVIIGIASGRGGSVQERLQQSLPERVWRQIVLGLYNCGCITALATPPRLRDDTSEFLSHVARIVERLKQLRVPIESIRTTHPYQVSVRFREGVRAEDNWFVIADALRQAGLHVSNIVHSKHSVDVLAPGVNKSHLIAHIIQQFACDPYQVLAIGDQGAWPGNDAALLEHRFSLSVDQPSRRLDRGWKLAPESKRDVDATLWYLERVHLLEGGNFTIRLSHSPAVITQ